MTISGPKPLPRNVRYLVGARGVRTNKPQKPVAEPPVKIPHPPEYLSADEVDVFVYRARLLAGMRVMSEADVDLLAIYCRNFVEAQKARKALAESSEILRSPNGYPIMNPWLAIARKAEDRCVRILTEFGMSPSSRNRVSQ